MTEVVLLNSGGIDSRVVAAMLKASEATVHSLTLDWNPGARHRVLPAALATAGMYADSHFVFEYPVDWMLWSSVIRRVRMPFAAFAAVAIGSQYAAQRDVSWVATGRRYQSVEVPAGSTDQMQEVLNQSRLSSKLVLLSPVFDLDDAGVNAKALELGVDLTSTESCLEPERCATCASCKRRERFGL